MIFKLIKWFFKTLFLIIGSLPLFRCFSGNDEKVKFNGKVITDKNFIVLNKQFAKDTTTAYYKSRAFSYADVPTFEAVDDHYAKDKNAVYYCDEYREGQNYYLTKKQTIVNLENADPVSFISLQYGYAKDNQKAWFEGKHFKVEDITSLVIIDYHFCKDDKIAYLNRHPIKESHGKTFEVIDRNYARDAVNIYYYGYTGEGQNNICILPCHRESFEILDDRYSKDHTNVFFLGFKVKNADGSTFQVLAEDYSKDQQTVFFQERKVTDADPKSFEVYEENGMYGHDFNFARDHKSVFMDDKKVSGADVATFTVLGENYARDKNHVYYKTAVVKNAVPTSFRVYPHDVGNADAEDALNKYHQGKKVTDD